jgi:hypothetical protein
MKEHLPDWIGGFITGDQQQLVGLLGLATLVVLAYLLRIPLRSWQEKRRIRRAVKRLGARVMRDVNLPDGMGGAINIDYLVLAADAIRVIGVKRYDGMIFGSANTDEWTQTLNSRSYRFPNPDIYLAQQLGAVRSIIAKVPVKGLHLFTDSAMFPWDKPDNVLQTRDLLRKDITSPSLKDIPADLNSAWLQLAKARQP